jgi:hypothetical protein
MKLIGWRPEGSPEGNAIQGVTFLGFVASRTPCEPGARETIASGATAGIRAIMLGRSAFDGGSSRIDPQSRQARASSAPTC